MRAFIAIGLAIIWGFILLSALLELGWLDCAGQPCSGTPVNATTTERGRG